MLWLVTGAGGMLGRDLCAILGERGEDVTAARHGEMDITDAATVDAAVHGYDVVVNAAAYTDVDGAERDVETARAVNTTGASLLATACARHRVRLVHISTDYVFDGMATTPYRTDAPTAPRSIYGQTKLAGEQAVLADHPNGATVVRTAWLYGRHGRNFVTTMARLARERDHVDVVTDQRGQPTWSHDVAVRIADLVEADAPTGIYHATNTGQTTWYGLARAVFSQLGLDPDRVRETTTDNFPSLAPRPAYSVLDHDGWRRAGLGPMRAWEAAFAAAAPVVLADF
ncbi:dTDP-4-dehydrorhamnose reductase [Haloactinopolyspora alba]|uniref:dTDP-4-dehydrorhamnose reductase n=1 Tax=Haloactinopolyspora alba TaxID=648780 RepID=A0A2P8E0W3_9ACTN|nr:dTDP-4-dehydrorhamnose reductase [Haloactinopolyspora alba]PSL03112.1 dTDP-4-dehydrorhamnose reductase [Haloactinopolyspora alba]